MRLPPLSPLSPLRRLRSPIPAAWRKSLARYGGRWALGLLLTLGACCQLVGLLPSEVIERLDNICDGLRMQARPAVLDMRIVIVDIDEASLVSVGRWPWSRDVVARLVGRLGDDYRARAIGFDVVFSEPDTSSGYAVLERLAGDQLKNIPAFREQLGALRAGMDYDGLLARAMQGRPVVLGYNVSALQKKGLLPAPAFTVDALHGREVDALESPGYEANLARLQQAARGAGIFTAITDADGILRASTLLQRIGDGYYPSLSLALAAVALDASAVAPYFATSADGLSQAQLSNGGLDYVSIVRPTGSQVAIPVGEALTTTIEYRGRGGPGGGAFTYVSAADVLSGKADHRLLDGRIVLVGTTAPGLNDVRATPVNREYPGVEVHANLVRSILDNSFKHRPDYAVGAELLQLLAAGIVLSILLPLLSSLWALLATVAALAAAIGFNGWMYAANDAVLNIALCLLLILLLFVMNMSWGYLFEVRKGRALVSRFGEYVAPELVAEMADDPERYTMEGASRELSVLFADVRGFTTISETLSPKVLREYINLYLTAMSEDIRDSHRGTLDKYIGDAVMAFWGAPVAQLDHASRAVASALTMQQSARRLDAAFQARGWPPLQIGIGVNTGLMHVGDMGSKIRRAYTVMGDAVNLAARLEGVTKTYGVGIVAGAATREAAPGFCWRELDLVRVKGKNAPVAIFEPLGLLSDVPPELVDELARWHAALADVRAQRWDAAGAALEELAAARPGALLYRLYLQRLAQYRLDPPGPGWDGVTRFDTK